MRVVRRDGARRKKSENEGAFLSIFCGYIFAMHVLEIDVRIDKGNDEMPRLV